MAVDDKAYEKWAGKPVDDFHDVTTREAWQGGWQARGEHDAFELADYMNEYYDWRGICTNLLNELAEASVLRNKLTSELAEAKRRVGKLQEQYDTIISLNIIRLERELQEQALSNNKGGTMVDLRFLLKDGQSILQYRNYETDEEGSEWGHGWQDVPNVSESFNNKGCE